MRSVKRYNSVVRAVAGRNNDALLTPIARVDYIPLSIAAEFSGGHEDCGAVRGNRMTVDTVVVMPDPTHAVADKIVLQERVLSFGSSITAEADVHHSVVRAHGHAACSARSRHAERLHKRVSRVAISHETACFQ